MRRVADKFRADQKRLGDPSASPARRIVRIPSCRRRQIILQHWQILWSGDDEHLAIREHQSRQWVADHWLVVDRSSCLHDLGKNQGKDVSPRHRREE